MTTRVLFVCLGNICRSPTAEGIFRAMLSPKDDIETDSAGTGAYHIGNPPDPRAIAEATTRGIDISDLRARQVERSDFDRFDLILAMDSDNLANLRKMAPEGCRAQVKLMLSYGAGGDVPDPYYDGNFERAYELIEPASRKILETLSTT